MLTKIDNAKFFRLNWNSEYSKTKIAHCNVTQLFIVTERTLKIYYISTLKVAYFTPWNENETTYRPSSIRLKCCQKVKQKINHIVHPPPLIRRKKIKQKYSLLSFYQVDVTSHTFDFTLVVAVYSFDKCI